MDDQQEIMNQLAAIDAELERFNNGPEAVVAEKLAAIDKAIDSVRQYSTGMDSPISMRDSLLRYKSYVQGDYVADEIARLTTMRTELEGLLS